MSSCDYKYNSVSGLYKHLSNKHISVPKKNPV